MIKGRRERIEIAARVCTGALDLLKRCVIPLVAKDALRGRFMTCVRRVALCQTKIEQDHVSARRDLEILRLNIAVKT